MDLGPEVLELLRAGAAHDNGICCRPGQVQKLWPVIREAERAGYVRLLDVEKPWVTDAGRKAIGAPSQTEADYARLRKLCRRRRKPLPRPADDPRTDFDYRSYRSLNYVCVLLVKQQDDRYAPSTIRVGRTLTSDPQFLGPKNSIILPESEGRFVLALMPHWLISKAMLPSYPLALDDTDSAWSDDERALYDRLRNVCISVNTRIRRGGSRQPAPHLHFGEYA
ncbi:hypothetical protein ABIB96_001235 [Bradyrhizobium sp. LA3.X]|uniref:hypothetical protein n=1 Tax=Bradyrhizobium sp. LA3.X TaxID=3156377 RepID=UPI003395D91D